MLWVRRHEPEAWARGPAGTTRNSYVVRQAHRRVRARPPHAPARATRSTTSRALRLGADWVPRSRRRPGDAAAGLAARGGRHGDRGGRRARPGSPAGHAGLRRHRRRLGRGVQRRRPRARRPDAHVRLHDVLRAGAGAVPGATRSCGPPPASNPGSYTLAAGMATSRRADHLAAGAHRRRRRSSSWSREAAAIPPGADGLLVLPYFAGERTPIFDPRARGVVAGLTLRHGRGHLFRAAYEGIAFGIRQILEFLDDRRRPGQRGWSPWAAAPRAGSGPRSSATSPAATAGHPRADHRRQLRRRADGRDRHRPGRPRRPTGRSGADRPARTRPPGRSTRSCSRVLRALPGHASRPSMPWPASRRARPASAEPVARGARVRPHRRGGAGSAGGPKT